MSDAAVAAAGPAPAPSSAFHAWKDPKGFGFRDLIDIVNPLQHLPIIGSIYRWVTGDRPGAAAQIAGDALYGGPIGVGVSLLSAATEDSQGHDVGERVIAAIFGPSDAKTTAVAAAAPATAPAAGPQPAGTPTAPVPARADHPPIPLYGFGGVATPVPSAQPAAANQNTAAHDFLARNAALERSVSAGTRYAPGMSAPVPLMLPPGSLQPPRLKAAPAAATAAAPSQANTPIDIPQKMMDGLDKYMKLEQERRAQPAGSGAAPQAVDLSL